MATEYASSEFRVEKERIDAVITLSNGDSTQGHFFVARGSAHYSGPERVGELLNAGAGVLSLRAARSACEPDGPVQPPSRWSWSRWPRTRRRRVPGYDVATERFVSVLLSNGDRVAGAVRVYRPEGRDRLSDWARNADIFRYIETGETTLLVNIAHVIEVSEVSKP